MSSQLWKHQRMVADFLHEKEQALIAADPRTGKTLAALTWAKEMGFKRTLIVTKKTIVPVWANEAQKHIGDDFLVFAETQGSTIVKATKIGMWLEVYRGLTTAAVINYDLVWREFMKETLDNARFDAVIVDESHKIKAHNSKVSKALWKLGKRSGYRAALTGTPFSNGLMDAYGQFRFLDDRIFGTNFKKFQSHYGILEPVWGAPGVVSVVGYRNTDEFQEKINSRTIVVRAKDVLDMPPTHHQTYPVDLSAAGRRAYKQMKQEMLTEWRGGQLVAANALVKGLRLQQITGQDEAKAKMLVDILEDFPAGEPVVVWAKFKEDIKTIRQVCWTLGLTYHELSGDVNDLELWREGRSQVLIAQIETGAEGIDLSRARYFIYYSNTYSYGSYEQSLSRGLRDGGKGPVFYYHLIARETVDEDVYSALSNKQSVAEAVLSAVKR